MDGVRPAVFERVHDLDEGKPLEVRIAGDDAPDAVLAHEHRSGEIVRSTAAQTGQLTRALRQQCDVAFRGDQDRTYRQETGVLLKNNRAGVNALYDEQRKAIERVAKSE